MKLNTTTKTGDNINTMLKPIIISIIIHILLAVYFITIQYHSKNNNELKDNSVEVTLIYDTKQVTERSAHNDMVPENANFLSDKNNVTLKQTKKKFSHGIVGNMPNNQILGSIPTGYKHPASGFLGRAVASDVSKSQSYLEVDEGSDTILNTREFLYFTYYLRIKQQLQGYWEHYIKQQINRLLVSSVADYIGLNKRAKLLIVLDEFGHLTNVSVLEKSGFKGLDDSAIDAVSDAHPFPPPPKGLLENNEVMIAWEFVLYNAN